MAKINVEADTDSDQLTVTVNGNMIANVQNACFYMMKRDYYSAVDTEPELSVQIGTMSIEDGIMTQTYLIAADTNDGKKAIQNGAKASPQFDNFVVKVDNGKFQRDVATFLMGDNHV